MRWPFESWCRRKILVLGAISVALIVGAGFSFGIWVWKDLAFAWSSFEFYQFTMKASVLEDKNVSAEDCRKLLGQPDRIAKPSADFEKWVYDGDECSGVVVNRLEIHFDNQSGKVESIVTGGNGQNCTGIRGWHLGFSKAVYDALVLTFGDDQFQIEGDL